MEIPCVFRDSTFLDDKIMYVCEFINKNIPENVHIVPRGEHQYSHTGKGWKNENVAGVIFNGCNLTKVPQGFTKIFPNMKILSIWGSDLKVVTKEDLVEYRKIERIGFCNNQIEYLPGDLFEGFENLEEVAFKGNKLELIDPNILDGLDKLKNINFKNNPGYTKCYSLLSGCQSNATFQEIKDELFVRFYRDYGKVKDFYKLMDENQALKDKVNLVTKENSNLQDQVHELRKENQNIKDENLKIKEDVKENPQKAESEIKKFLAADETFKDFKIIIDDREFPVHKFLLAARSPTLADLLKINPEVENLNLVFVSVEIFEKILKFLYTDELPGDDGTNFFHLFAAAGKLKIKGLMDYAATKLIDQINENNALDILKLSNKYDHKDLRISAFNKIDESYPKIDLKVKWAEDVDKIVEIIEAFKMKEEAVRKAEEEFKILFRTS